MWFEQQITFTFFVILYIFWLQEKELLELVAKELGSPSSKMRNQETRADEDGETGSSDVLDGMTLSETSDDDRVETSLDKSKELDTGSTNTSIDSDERKVWTSFQFKSINKLNQFKFPHAEGSNKYNCTTISVISG